MKEKAIELSIVMPCLNEIETLGRCIEKAKYFLEQHGIEGEIVVADNGSSDGSQSLAEKLGARVVSVDDTGYGNALMGGIIAARGTYIIMGDADDSYDFSRLDLFIEKLREGYDLVMGNRFKGGIKPGAMPFLHKYIGNPCLTGIGRLFFRCPCSDFHCGLRGFKKNSILRLNLVTSGMEFASEMVIKASLFGMRIAEVPTVLSPDGRTRPPHLRSWRDGWRHLRFMLLYSPRWLFLYPGFLLMVLGLMVGVRLMFGSIIINSVSFDVQTLLFVSTALIIGYQSVLFALFSKIFAVNEGLLPKDSQFQKLSNLFSLEIGILVGLLLLIIGIAGSVSAVLYWGEAASFGRLDPSVSLRIIIPSITGVIVGMQTIFASFFISFLDLKVRGRSK